MVKKINLAKAKDLVDELGAVEEYSRELKAEVDVRKEELHQFVGRTLVGDEFEAAIYKRQGRTLDKAKLMKKFGLTEKQLASCYKATEESLTVSIKRIGAKKSEQRKEFVKAAKKKVRS